MPFEGVNPPKEPANYDPENKFKDPVAYFKHREAAVAEKYVHMAEAKVRTSFFFFISNHSSHEMSSLRRSY